MKEKMYPGISGLVGVPIQLSLLGYIIYGGYNLYADWAESSWTGFIPLVIALIGALICFGGYTTIAPNDYNVVQFMGKYKGTLSANGFWFINPFCGGFAGSFKTENYQTPELTVNEKGGTPIEIAAIISYKVKDTYAHSYNTQNAEVYVKNQFEISLRQHARLHSYSELVSDDHDFVEDITKKVEAAGIEILDAKITHLSYATEVAGAMLQKQQATAMSEAKQIIVDNAVSIAQHAAKEINGDMSPADKSRFLSNLIVVLCSDKAASPVVDVSN